jgi:hypothetical protein
VADLSALRLTERYRVLGIAHTRRVYTRHFPFMFTVTAVDTTGSRVELRPAPWADLAWWDFVRLGPTGVLSVRASTRLFGDFTMDLAPEGAPRG